ncbi:hypothetical protein [Puia sp.]|nr:hypothetical protein [Puia sp.]
MNKTMTKSIVCGFVLFAAHTGISYAAGTNTASKWYKFDPAWTRWING